MLALTRPCETNAIIGFELFKQFSLKGTQFADGGLIEVNIYIYISILYLLLNIGRIYAVTFYLKGIVKTIKVIKTHVNCP